MDRIRQAIRALTNKWWGIWAAYGILFLFFYGAIWAAIEPLSIPDSFKDLPRFFSQRWFYHIVIAVILALHVTLILDAVVKRLKRYGSQTISPPEFEFAYGVARAKEFYDRIAIEYDKRNSLCLLKTHQCIIAAVKNALDKDANRVLDLGGGTGKLIANHFFDRNDMHWDYVDYSVAMVEQFRANLSGTALRQTVHIDDIDTFISRAERNQYDVILLALALTSMNRNPDWACIEKLLQPHGRLIVADIDAAYTATHPYYIVSCADGRHGLRPRPVPLTQLVHELKNAGLHLQGVTPVFDAEMNYAYVAEFARGNEPV